MDIIHRISIKLQFFIFSKISVSCDVPCYSGAVGKFIEIGFILKIVLVFFQCGAFPEAVVLFL